MPLYPEVWKPFGTKPDHVAALLPGPGSWGGLGFHIWVFGAPVLCEMALAQGAGGVEL